MHHRYTPWYTLTSNRNITITPYWIFFPTRHKAQEVITFWLKAYNFVDRAGIVEVVE